MDLSETKQFRPLTYVVPGNPATDEYLLPVSGGGDSTALAILLHEVAPHIPFRLVFTDTGAEEQETLDALDRLEQWLGKPIERLQSRGLFDLIEDFNGFLPSPQDRYCTRELKLVPFRNWIAQFAGKTKWMFVGIRADESFRLAFTLPETETVMPYIDLGIKREWVYQKLSQTVGVPKSYQTRSRSGCTVCPYQRTSELVGLLQRSPVEFERGAQCEKLNPMDAQRHPEGIALWQDTRTAKNWHSLPVPLSDEEIQKGKMVKAKMPDLFGARVFVGGEFFMDGMLAPDEFIWHQRLACFSNTLDGVKKQLDGRYQHLLSAGEVYGMTEEEVREKAKFAIWYVELPNDVFDPQGVKGEGENRSYTWHQGKSYRQIRHVVEWATRALHAEFQRREAAKSAPLLSVQYEWTEAAQRDLDEATAPVGSVLLSQWYQPSEKVVEPENEEEVLRLMPCPMCQL